MDRGSGGAGTGGAAVQAASVALDRDATLDKVELLTAEAAGNGAATALCGIVLATTAPRLGIAGAVLCAVLIGIAVGVINGTLVTVVGVNSLIVTLGGLAAFRGVENRLEVVAVIDGITTRYEVVGTGPPLLMFSPGGFNAVVDNWSTFSVYGRVRPVEHLSTRYTCIMFDRREAGQSGGRVERVTWNHYAEQGKGLLDHLGIDRAHVMGGCQGCSLVTTFAVSHPGTVLSMVLYWPAGGPKYRITGQSRFAQHLAYVQADGLAGVVELARAGDKHFGQDPRVGPWATVLRRDEDFAGEYAGQDVDRYRFLVSGMSRTLFDRDTVPGAEPEDMFQLDLPALIVPGQDASHSASAARYLEECLPAAEHWDIPVAEQTEQTVPPRLLDFLDAVSSQRPDGDEGGAP
jgi:pimeloyl-ACP methyl ester carboxylesterase